MSRLNFYTRNLKRVKNELRKATGIKAECLKIEKAFSERKIKEHEGEVK